MPVEIKGLAEASERRRKRRGKNPKWKTRIKILCKKIENRIEYHRDDCFHFWWTFCFFVLSKLNPFLSSWIPLRFVCVWFSLKFLPILFQNRRLESLRGFMLSITVFDIFIRHWNALHPKFMWRLHDEIVFEWACDRHKVKQNVVNKEKQSKRTELKIYLPANRFTMSVERLCVRRARLCRTNWYTKANKVIRNNRHQLKHWIRF